MIILYCVILSLSASGLAVSPTKPRPSIKPRKCSGINESWQIGHGGCDPTCEYPDLVCEAIVNGCFCNQGFVRHNGICIDSKACPQKCTRENESWQTGHGGCDPTCENPNLRCEALNAKGCFCNPGFVRHNGECIDVKYCPNRICSGINESYQICHGGCEGTCDDQNPQCKACKTGCFCNKGFVRENGMCIDKTLCDYIKKSSQPPQECNGQNEIWKTNFGCDPTCQEPNKKCYDRKNGCFCIDGYVRNENNECIKREECIKLNCNENEVEDWCPERCKFDITCGFLIEGIITPCIPPPDPDISPRCYPRCYCKPGLVRINDDCLPPTACCGKDEKLVKCPAKCDFTIKDGPPKPDCELKPCNVYGCRCSDRYARNEENVCVKADKCHD